MHRWGPENHKSCLSRFQKKGGLQRCDRRSVLPDFLLQSSFLPPSSCRCMVYPMHLSMIILCATCEEI